MKNTMLCLVQDRLGALDRVLGALTHRGWIPESFSARRDEQSGFLQVTLSFECEEEKAVEKLLKFLNNQVYVLETQILGQEQLAPVPIPVSASSSVSPLALYAARTQNLALANNKSERR